MFIDVKDNFLSDEDLMTAKERIESLPWRFGQASKPNTPMFWLIDLKDEYFFTHVILKKINEKYCRNFELLRISANGQTYGLDGTFHQDDTSEDAYTFLLYLSDITPENVDVIGGFTQFRTNEQILNVEPYINRGVLFNSKIHHRGMAPSRESYILRISIAYKLIEKKNVM